MKNQFILFSFLLASFFIQAQPYTNRDKLLITSRVDSLLQTYMQKSSLTEPGQNKQSTKVIKELKNLFAPEAIIFDDINAEFNDDQSEFPYKLTEKSRNVYFDGLVEQFPKGLLANSKNVNINYDNIDQGFVKVALARNISGVRSSGKYNLYNEDTLILKINVQPDKSVKISNISILGYSLKVLNDQDLDGVIDTEDECKDEKGKISLKGCPDADDDNIPDKNDDCPDQPGTTTNHGCPPTTFAYQFVFSGSTGFSMNLLSVSKPTPNDLGYPASLLDRNQSYAEVENPGFRGSNINLSANIAYYYGKKQFSRNKGISLGVSVITYNASYYESGTKLVYKSYDDKVLHPKGVRKIKNFNVQAEHLDFLVWNFPLQYRIKAKLGSRWAGEIGLGPGFNLVQVLKSKIEQNSDVYLEGVFQYNVSNNFEEGYDESLPFSYADVPLTKESIRGKLFNPDEEFLFQNLSDRSSKYTYGRRAKDETFRENDVKRFTSISLNLNADLFYHVKPKIAIKFGLAMVYSPDQLRIGNKAAINTHIEDEQTPDFYNPILNSSAKKSYVSFGFNIGIILGIRTSKS